MFGTGLPRKPKVMTTPIFEAECLSFSPSYNLDQGGLDCRRNNVRVFVAKFSILLLDEVNTQLSMSM